MNGPSDDGVYPKSRLEGGVAFVYYALRFDEQGACISPKTRERLIEDARSGGYSDIFVFSHGWNNPWHDAEDDLYTPFITNFHEIVRVGDLGRAYKPLWIGIHWPSAELVLPWEQGPEVAPADPDAAPLSSEPGIDALLSRLDADEAKRLLALVSLPSLDSEAAREFLGLLVKAVGHPADEDLPGIPAPSDVNVLVNAWASEKGGVSEPVGSGVPGLSDSAEVNPEADAPQAAGKVLTGARDVARLYTVWPMKDRAGLVGKNGVGPLIQQLREAAPGSALRLLGHSFGAKVVLSALGCSEFASLQAESALLLQAAISARCFAADAYNGTSGGYHEVPERVKLPITMTFSREDVPLHDAFHLAVCRRYDVGERQPAPAGAPVPLFAALGGYGPQRVAGEAISWPIQNPDDPYPVPADKVGKRLIALDGDGVIHGHGDVKNMATAWALYYLMLPKSARSIPEGPP